MTNKLSKKTKKQKTKTQLNSIPKLFDLEANKKKSNGKQKLYSE